MAGEESKYPWWVRFTGGNRGYALIFAVLYTLVFAVNAVRWLTKSDGWAGALAIGFILLAIWAWAVVVYLRGRNHETGDRRGW